MGISPRVTGDVVGVALFVKPNRDAWADFAEIQKNWTLSEGAFQVSPYREVGGCCLPLAKATLIFTKWIWILEDVFARFVQRDRNKQGVYTCYVPLMKLLLLYIVGERLFTLEMNHQPL